MDLIFNDPYFLDSGISDEESDILNNLNQSKPLDTRLFSISVGNEHDDQLEQGHQSQLDLNNAMLLNKLRAVYTWDAFLGSNSLQYNTDRGPKLQTRFVSDRPCTAYEAILANNDQATVIEVKLFVRCLKFLLVGRESQLFKLDRRYLKFGFQDQYQHDIRIYGFSREITQNICLFGIKLGSLIYRLRYTCNRVWKIVSKGPDSASQAMLTAFSENLDTIVKTIEIDSIKQINENSGLIELLNIFDKPFKIANVLCTVLGCEDIDEPIRLDDVPDSYKLLDELYTRAMIYQGSDEMLFDIVIELLEHVSRPWFFTLSELIGLTGDGSLFWRPVSDICTKMKFLQYDEEQQMIFMDEKSKPLFLDDQTVLKIIETLNCMIMFCKYGNGNLNILRSKTIAAPLMKWLSTEREISEFESQLMRYEHDEPVKVQDSEPIIDTLDIETLDIYSQPENIDKLIEDMNNKLVISDTIVETVPIHTGSTNNPPISAIPQLSFCKLINTQWKRANELAMTIFKGDPRSDIRMYTDLIKSVFLFGSGTFVRDLEDALYGTNFGCLDLDNRQTWPPMEREVNQSLSDVVEHCLIEKGYDSREIHFNFGLLESSDSIKASDFNSTDILDLIFIIPMPFSLVISNRLINIYKSIFSHLLQLQRLLHLVKSNPAHTPSLLHFIYCIYQHVITVIDMNWKNINQGFEKTGITLEHLINLYQSTAKNIYRQIHISKSSSRQIMAIMEMGFKLVGGDGMNRGSGTHIDDPPVDLSLDLETQIMEFYKNLASRQNQQNHIDNLLVNLDFNGYYSRMI